MDFTMCSFMELHEVGKKQNMDKVKPSVLHMLWIEEPNKVGGRWICIELHIALKLCFSLVATDFNGGDTEVGVAKAINLELLLTKQISTAI